MEICFSKNELICLLENQRIIRNKQFLKNVDQILVNLLQKKLISTYKQKKSEKIQIQHQK
jgi:hypothetical protein